VSRRVNEERGDYVGVVMACLEECLDYSGQLSFCKLRLLEVGIYKEASTASIDVKEDSVPPVLFFHKWVRCLSPTSHSTPHNILPSSGHIPPDLSHFSSGLAQHRD